jgi:hypothetical protein
MTTIRHGCLLGVLFLCFAGCDGGGTSTGDEVTGRIVDSSGAPAANVLVHVGSTSTRTGLDGRFVVGGVTTPYDLHVGGVGNVVGSYLGLTLRTLPDLYQPGGPSGPAPEAVSATITGTLAGGSITAPNRIVYVVFCAERACDSVGTTTGGYVLPVTIGAQTATGKLLALEATYDAGGAPTGWGQLAIASATVTAGAITVQDLVLTTPITPRTVAGTLTVPAGIDSIQVSYALSDGTSGWGVHALTMYGGGALGVILPELPGFAPQYNVFGYGYTPYNISNAWGLIPENDLVIDLAAPVALTAPPAGAAVTAETDFTWTPRAGAVHSWRALCPGAVRYVRTTEGTARFFGFEGYPLPAGDACTWAVFTYEPFASMDAFVADDDWASYPFGAPTYTASERGSFQLQ